MDDMEVVSVYSLERAIADGVLVEIFKNHWNELSDGKPIVATRAIYVAFSLSALQKIWNEYALWRQDVMPTLPEEEQLFSTTMNSETVWVLEDGDAFTILFPDDY
jgi:hypothetical protein